MQALISVLLLAALPSRIGGGVNAGIGDVPNFALGQDRVVTAIKGDSALLECRVQHLGDKGVSWIRSRDLQILSHAGIVFTADQRVSAGEVVGDVGTTTHWLRIEQVRVSDAGRYECQVNTEPKLSLFYNLTVQDDLGAQLRLQVRELKGGRSRGTDSATVTLVCEAGYGDDRMESQYPPPQLRWLRGGQPLEVEDGGIAVETARSPGRAESRLTIIVGDAEVGGRYTCSAGNVEAHLDLKMPTEVVGAEQLEAMQRDQGDGTPTTGGSDPEVHSSTIYVTFLSVLGLLLLM